MKALIYAAGVLTGMAMMMANRYSVKKAVEAERARADRIMEENRALRQDISDMTRANDCRDALRKGRELERRSPVSAAERFARNFEGKKVQFRGGKTAC